MRRRAQGRPGREGTGQPHHAAVRSCGGSGRTMCASCGGRRVRPADDGKRSRAAEDLPGPPEQRNDSALFMRRKRPRSGTHLSALGGTYGGLPHSTTCRRGGAGCQAFMKVVLYLIPFWIAWYPEAGRKAGDWIAPADLLPGLLPGMDRGRMVPCPGQCLRRESGFGGSVLKFFKVAPGGAAGYAPQGGGPDAGSGGTSGRCSTDVPWLRRFGTRALLHLQRARELVAQRRPRPTASRSSGPARRA